MMKKSATSSRKEFYCSCCDVDLKASKYPGRCSCIGKAFHEDPDKEDAGQEKVFDNHVNGKKHKKNQKAAQEKHTAECTIFVSFSAGTCVKEKHIWSYFNGFGEIDNVQIDRGHAFVRFKYRQSAKVVLKNRKHQFKSLTFEVGQIPQAVEKKQIKKEDEHHAIREMLNHMEDVPQQFSFLTEHLLLSRQDLHTRQRICDELSLIFYPYFETLTVHQFGSSINGYGMQGCDLDLFLDFNDDTQTVAPRQKKILPLPFKVKGVKTLPSKEIPLTTDLVAAMDDLDKVKFICQILRRYTESFRQLCVVPSKRCPLVKFVHHTGLKCDLSLNNRKGLYNSRLLRLYSQDPRVQQLVIAVRYWAKVQQLTNPVNTTVLFTSYALTWLVLYYLFHRKPRVIPLVNELSAVMKDQGVNEETVDVQKRLHIPLSAKLPQSQNQESTAELFHGFFQFYASSVDWDNQALSTWDGQMMPKSSLVNPMYAGCKIGVMTMLDPLVVSHNIVGNVNEKARMRFEAQVKKALEVTQQWPRLAKSQTVNPWGLAELFIPSPPDPLERKKNGKKNHQLQGEQKGGIFTLTLHPTSQILNSKEFVQRSEEMKMTPNAFWCSLVKKMIVNVLETVYLIDVQQTLVEEFGVHKEEMKMGQKVMQENGHNMNVEECLEDFDIDVEDIEEIIENKDGDENVEGFNKDVNVDEIIENKDGDENVEGFNKDVNVDEIIENKDGDENVEGFNEDVNVDEIIENKDGDENVEDVNVDEIIEDVDENEHEYVSISSSEDNNDEMMETEGVETKQQLISEGDNEQENCDINRSETCKRSVQKSDNAASKKLKRDAEAEEVEIKSESEATLFSSHLLSDVSSRVIKDSESRIAVNEQRKKEAGIGPACASSNTNEERKLTSLQVDNNQEAKQNSPSEQIMKDTVNKVFGPLNKVSKISSYSCCTKKAMWLYRAQMRMSLASNTSLKGLALEQAVSKIILKKLDKKCSARLSGESVSSTPSIAAVSSTMQSPEQSNAVSEDLAASVHSCTNDTGNVCCTKKLDKTLENKTGVKCQSSLAKGAINVSHAKSEKDSKNAANEGENASLCTEAKAAPIAKQNKKLLYTAQQPKEKPRLCANEKRKSRPPSKEKGKSTAPTKEKGKSPPQKTGKSPKNVYETDKIPFRCKIVESHAEGTNSPSVSIVMHTYQTSSFRNIYASANNVIIQLVSSHLLDIDV